MILLGKPLSTQHAYKTTCVNKYARIYITDKGKATRDYWRVQAKEQWGEFPPIQDELEVNIILYFGDKRKRDLDNHLKLVIDALTGVCFEDDSQIIGLHVYKEYDKENPRVEINIV